MNKEINKNNRERKNHANTTRSEGHPPNWQGRGLAKPELRRSCRFVYFCLRIKTGVLEGLKLNCKKWWV